MTTAVIPNWNGGERLRATLRSLEGQGFDRVLVVDNGSSDGSDVAAEQAGSEVIRLGCNFGFARAVNVGVEKSTDGYVALINNDVELDEGWLGRLRAALEADGRQWFAVGKIRSARNQQMLDGTFDATSRAACSWRCGQNRPDGEAWESPATVVSAPMTAALFRRELFQKLGGLDERFESYLEDVDFGLRCAGAGFTGVFLPDAQAQHWGSATLGVWHPETVRRMARNQIYLLAKHFPQGWGWRMGWAVLAGQLLWGGVALQHGCGWAWLKGKWQGIRDYRRMRASEPVGSMERILREQEELIRRLQESTGFDRYWKIYFALTA